MKMKVKLSGKWQEVGASLQKKTARQSTLGNRLGCALMSMCFPPLVMILEKDPGAARCCSHSSPQPPL